MAKKRRWKRLLVVAGGTLLALLLLARVLVHPLLPPLLESAAEGQGYRCSYDRLELSLLTGDVELWHLLLQPLEDDHEIVHVEYVRADLSMWDLFAGNLVVRRLEVDGLDVDLERTATGELRWLKRPATTELEADAPGSAPPEATGPPALPPRIEVNALRLQHLRVRLKDDFLSSPQTLQLDGSLRISNLMSAQRPTRITAEFATQPNPLWIALEGTAQFGEQEITTDLQARIHLVDTKAWTPYLEPAGLRAVGSQLSVQAGLRATLRQTGASDSPLAAEVQLADLGVSQDGVPSLRLQQLHVKIADLGASSFQVEEVRVRDLYGEAHRNTAGNLEFAGFEQLPVDRTGSPRPPPSAPPETTPSAFALRGIDRIVLERLHFLWTDASLGPEARLELLCPEGRLESIAPGKVATLHLLHQLPGCVEELRIDGTMALLDPDRFVEIDLQGSGITAQSVQPYLRAAGWESTFEDGRLGLHVRAELRAGQEAPTAQVSLTDMHLEDRGESLALGRLEVMNLQFRREPSRLTVEEVQFTGVRLKAVREEDGLLHLLGLRQLAVPVPGAAENGSGPTPRGDTPRAPAAPTTPDEGPLQIALQHLYLGDHQIEYHDRSSTPATSLQVTDLGLDLTHFHLGQAEEQSAQLKVWVNCPSLFQSLAIEGSLHLEDQAGRVELQLAGEGVDLDGLEPLLARHSIEPILQGGQLAARIQGRFDRSAGLKIDAGLHDLRLRDRARTWFSLGEVQVEGLALGGGPVAVGAVRIQGPELTVIRELDGALQVAGMRFLPAAPESSPAEAQPPGPRAPAGPPAPTLAAESPASSTPEQPAAEQLMLGALDLVGLQVAFEDQALETPLRTELSLEARVRALAVRGARVTADFETGCAVPGAIAALGVRGSLRGDGPTQRIQVELRGTGIQNGPWSAYLPEGLRCGLRDGQLGAQLEAEVLADGPGIRLELTGLAFEEAGQPAFLRIDRVALDAPRLRAAERDFHLQDLALSGLRLRADFPTAGVVSLLGFELGDAAPGAEPASPAAPPAPRSLALDGWTLQLQEPFVWSREDASGEEKLDLQLVGGVTPALRQLRMGFLVTELESTPTLSLNLDLEGIDGPALHATVPGLEKRIDATSLKDGTVHTQLEIGLRPGNPADPFDFSRPFGAEILWKGLHVQPRPEAAPELGFEQIRADVRRVDLATGEVHCTAIEILKPIAHLLQRKEGLSVAGVVWKNAPAAEASADGAEARTGADVAARDAPPAPAPPAQGSGRVRVDQVFVEGIDVVYADESVTPPLLFPLSDLALQVKGLDTAARHEALPLRFQMLLEGGKAPVGQSAESVPVLGELLVRGQLLLFPSLQGSITTGIEDLQLRTLTGIAEANGVTLSDGLLSTQVNLLWQENGTLEVDSETTFTDLDLDEVPDGPISRYLHLPAPLQSVVFVLRNETGAIRLPIGLEVPSEGLSLPQVSTLVVTTLGKLIVDAITSSPFRVVGSVGDIVGSVGDMVGATELTGAVGEWIGLGGGEEGPAAEEFRVRFEAGTLAWDTAGGEALQRVRQTIARNPRSRIELRHDFGAADLEMVERRARPPAELLGHLVERWRFERRETIEARRVQLEQTRLNWALDPEPTRLRRAAALRALDEHVAQLEQRIAEALDRMRVRSPEQQERLTSKLGRRMAEDRLQAVATALNPEEAPDLEQRIRLRRPRFEAGSDRPDSRIEIVVTHRKEP